MLACCYENGTMKGVTPSSVASLLVGAGTTGDAIKIYCWYKK